MKRPISKVRNKDAQDTKEQNSVNRIQIRAAYAGLVISMFAAILSMINTYMMWKQIDQQNIARSDTYKSNYYQSKIDSFSEFSDAANHLYGILVSFHIIGFKKGKVQGSEVSQMYANVQKYSGNYSSSWAKAKFFMPEKLEKSVYEYSKIQANALDCTNQLVHQLKMSCDIDKFLEFISDDGKRLKGLQKSLQMDANPNNAIHSL